MVLRVKGDHGENQNVIGTSTFVHVTTDGEVSTDE
jgi:hypothetical protein